jgi:hypothetical protein
MRGKERFSAPGKTFDYDVRFSAGQGMRYATTENRTRPTKPHIILNSVLRLFVVVEILQHLPRQTTNHFRSHPIDRMRYQLTGMLACRLVLHAFR